MKKTLLPIRIVFVTVCVASGWLVCYVGDEMNAKRGLGALIGLLLGVLVVLVDILLKGFSLRGLSAVTFGLAVGTLIAYMIETSPLFRLGDAQTIYLFQLAIFLVCTYLATVIALRGKDEFNLVIPYVRFVPQEVDIPLVVVDTSGLIDGRIARVCESGFLTAALVIPRFVLTELQAVADSPDPHKQARGRRGLEVLGELRKVKNICAFMKAMWSNAKKSTPSWFFWPIRCGPSCSRPITTWPKWPSFTVCSGSTSTPSPGPCVPSWCSVSRSRLS
jgi:hypothetical protein